MNLYARNKETNSPIVLLNFGPFHQFATEILERNGGTVLIKGPWLTNMEMLVTSDPANIHYILTKNFPNFPKGTEFKKIFEHLGDGIFIADAESWEIQRKTVKSLINHTSFIKFVATTSWNKVETGDLIPFLELGSEMGKEVDMQELFRRFSFDCSCVLVLGHDPASLCLELPHLPHEKAFADGEKAVFYRHILPEIYWKLQNWLQIGKEKKLSKAKETLDRFLSYCVSLKHQNFKAIDPTVTHGKDDCDMLTCYMRAVDENGEAANISEELWKDTMFNLLFAGKDTVSAALTWFFWLLATNPAEEKK